MKKIFSLILAFVMLLSFSVSADTSAEFKIDSTTFQTLTDTIETHDVGVAPYLDDNSIVMLPLRALSEAFGCTVTWKADSNAAEIKNDKVTVTATVGTASATVNDETITLSAPIAIVSGTTMAPLDLFAKAFGYNTDYLSQLGRVLVYDKPVVMTVNSADLQYDEFTYYYNLIYNSDDPSVDRDTVIQYLTALFKELLVYYDTAKASGFEEIINSEATVTEINDSIIKYELSEHKPVLPGTVASLVVKNKLAETYLSLIQQFTAPDEKASKKAYEESYVTAKHILIPTIDLTTGEAFSPVKKAEARKRAEELAKKIHRGANFDYIMKYNTADTTGLEKYPDGYTFTHGEMLTNFENAAFALEIGQVSDVIETEVGYHIIKRLPLAEMDESVSAAVANAAQAQSFQKYIEGLNTGASVTVNEDVIATIK